MHDFLFTPGYWLGEGKIKLNMMEDELPFYTKWHVALQEEDGKIEAKQEIQIAGISENMNNSFVLSDITSSGFMIELENQNVGKVVGKGLIKPDKIGWEFRLLDIGFEGFEFYEKTDDGYLLHAEYSTSDDFRTIIHGRVWKKAVINAGEIQ